MASPRRESEGEVAVEPFAHVLITVGVLTGRDTRMDRRQTVAILEAPYVSAGRGRRSSSTLIRRVSCTSPSAADWTPARRSPTPLQRAAGRRWLPYARDVNNCCQGTFGRVFPAASTSHISSDGTTELPGVPVSPLLFPPVSPDLSASVFSPSLCQTGRLSPSRHSRRRLAAAFISDIPPTQREVPPSSDGAGKFQLQGRGRHPVSASRGPDVAKTGATGNV